MTHTVRTLVLAAGIALAIDPSQAAARTRSVQGRLATLEKALKAQSKQLALQQRLMAAQVTAQSNQLALQQQLIIAQAAELQKLHRQTDLVAAKAPEQDAQILVLQDNAAQLKLKEQERPRLAYSGGDRKSVV